MKNFWGGFVKRAADTLGDAGAPVPAEAAAIAGDNREQAPEKMLKWNPQGGCDPRSPEEMAAAQGVDLITLPEGTEGASCGNCQFFRELDAGLGTGFCTNPEVKLDVTRVMHCSRWNAPDTYRAWEQEDPSAVPNASMMQEAGALSDQMQAAGPGAGAGLPPEMGAPGTMEGAGGEGPPSTSGAMPEPGAEGAPEGEGEGAAGAPPEKKPEKKEKKDEDKKESGSGHTINVHVNNGGKDDKKSEKKASAFWKGFGA